jgi:hypothetical protein
MVCLFCIAVLLVAAAAVRSATVDELQERLDQAAAAPAERETDTGSVTVWNATVTVDGRTAPVVITLYKNHRRVRIQVLTHELTREQVQALQERIAEALGLRIVERSDPEEEEAAQAAQRDEDAEEDEAPAEPEPEARRRAQRPPTR